MTAPARSTSVGQALLDQRDLLEKRGVGTTDLNDLAAQAWHNDRPVLVALTNGEATAAEPHCEGVRTVFPARVSEPSLFQLLDGRLDVGLCGTNGTSGQAEGGQTDGCDGQGIHESAHWRSPL